MNSVNQILFDTPAGDFTESLLIGNGRLGACVYASWGSTTGSPA